MSDGTAFVCVQMMQWDNRSVFVPGGLSGPHVSGPHVSGPHESGPHADTALMLTLSLPCSRERILDIQGREICAVCSCLLSCLYSMCSVCSATHSFYDMLF